MGRLAEGVVVVNILLLLVVLLLVKPGVVLLVVVLRNRQWMNIGPHQQYHCPSPRSAQLDLILNRPRLPFAAPLGGRGGLFHDPLASAFGETASPVGGGETNILIDGDSGRLLLLPLRYRFQSDRVAFGFVAYRFSSIQCLT
jgi:hypothetical protein